MMTTEYTPITAEVRSHYLYVRSGKWLNNPAPFEEEFDRWLQKVKADVVKEIIQEVRMIPNWGPRDDPMGGEFDLDGESHRRFVLETLLVYGDKFF